MREPEGQLQKQAARPHRQPYEELGEWAEISIALFGFAFGPIVSVNAIK